MQGYYLAWCTAARCTGYAMLCNVMQANTVVYIVCITCIHEWREVISITGTCVSVLHSAVGRSVPVHRTGVCYPVLILLPFSAGVHSSFTICSVWSENLGLQRSCRERVMGRLWTGGVWGHSCTTCSRERYVLTIIELAAVVFRRTSVTL